MARYTQIHARAHSMGQLGVVVAAMRGVSAAHAQQCQRQLESVRGYADLVADAISRVLPLAPAAAPAARRAPATALVVIGAEHGFAGAFSERILDRAQAHAGTPQLLLIGSRCLRTAQARGLRPLWSARMVAQLANAATLADQLGSQIYQLLRSGRAQNIDIIYARPLERQASAVVQEQLLPLDYGRFPAAALEPAPMLNLAPQALLERLAGEYLFAQLNEAIVHGFAAENLARLQTMTAAHDNIGQRLQSLSSEERLARQAEITAEIIELAAGTEAVATTGAQV